MVHLQTAVWPLNDLSIYTNGQKYVPIDFANLSKVIASKAKQSNTKHHDPLKRIRLLRRKAPTGLPSAMSSGRMELVAGSQ
jgi:hypothetical protein